MTVNDLVALAIVEAAILLVVPAPGLLLQNGCHGAKLPKPRANANGGFRRL
jgi:hypothetical protein